MSDYRLSDYERGYRAAQRRALRLADVAFDTEGAAEAWEETVKAMKIELAMPIPPDPHTLGAVVIDGNTYTPTRDEIIGAAVSWIHEYGIHGVDLSGADIEAMVVRGLAHD